MIPADIVRQATLKRLVESFKQTVTLWMVRSCPGLIYAKQKANTAKQRAIKVFALIGMQPIRSNSPLQPKYGGSLPLSPVNWGSNPLLLAQKDTPSRKTALERQTLCQRDASTGYRKNNLQPNLRHLSSCLPSEIVASVSSAGV
eukprot:scpid87986/ scgid27851/ 